MLREKIVAKLKELGARSTIGSEPSAPAIDGRGRPSPTIYTSHGLEFTTHYRDY